MTVTVSGSKELATGPFAKAGGFLRKPSGGLVAFLVAFCVILALVDPAFMTASNWFNILNQLVVLGLLSIGMTVVLISRGLDLSVGSIVGLSGGMSAVLLNAGAPIALAFIGAAILGTALGIVNGIVITKLDIPPFIATLAMLAIGRGALFVWTGAVPFRGYMTDGYYVVGGLRPLLGIRFLSLPVVIVLAIAVVVAVTMRSTITGRHIYAVGSNPESAELSGVRVDRIRIFVYGFSGLMSAAGGIVLAGRLTTVHPEMGQDMELQALAAAIIGGAALTGGRGHVRGALLGALALVLVQNAITAFGLDSSLRTMVVGAVILIAVLADRLIQRGALRQGSG